jgi:hypothetical protein
MRKKIVLLCVLVALVVAGVVAVKSLTLSKRISSTPVVVSSQDGLFKIDGNGRSTKLIDVRKDSISIWQVIGFYKDDLIYVKYAALGAPTVTVPSIACLNTTTGQSRVLTKDIAGASADAILVNNRLIFTTSSPYCLWSLDLDDNTKVNLAKGLERGDSNIGLTGSEYVVTEDATWIIFIAHDPTLKKDCYFSSMLDGGRRANLTGDISVPLIGLDSADGRLSYELTALSQDGTRVLFTFAYNGTELTYAENVDGSFRATLPYGHLEAFVNNDTEVIMVRELPNQPGGRSLWRISIDGKTQANLTQGLDGDCYDVKLAPSGDRIFFTFAPGHTERYALWSVKVDGTEKVNLSARIGSNPTSKPLWNSFIPLDHHVIVQMYDPKVGRTTLWNFDLEHGTATQPLGDDYSGNAITGMRVSRNGTYVLVTSAEKTWLMNVDTNNAEDLHSKVGDYSSHIEDDHFVYKDNKDTLWCVDLSSGNKLRIRDNFQASVQGLDDWSGLPAGILGFPRIGNAGVAFDSSGRDMLIGSVSGRGAQEYSLFDVQNQTFTDLNAIVTGTLYSAVFVQ